MSLNIKNERTVAKVRELAALTGQSQTSAIEAAVEAMLEQRRAQAEASDRSRRMAAAAETLAEIGECLSEGERDALRAAEADIYDEHGLPR